MAQAATLPRVGARPPVATGATRRLGVTPALLLAPSLLLLLLFATALVEFARASVSPFAPPGVVVAPGTHVRPATQGPHRLAVPGEPATHPQALGDRAVGQRGARLLRRLLDRAHRSARVRAALIIVVAVPFMTSLIVRLYALTLVLGNTGLVNTSLHALGVIPENEFVPLVRNQLRVAIGLTYFVLPFVCSPWRASFAASTDPRGSGPEPRRRSRADVLPVTLPLDRAGCARLRAPWPSASPSPRSPRR